MTLDELDCWLDTYGRAWERKDSDSFVGCFADYALYAWGPWRRRSSAAMRSARA